MHDSEAPLLFWKAVELLKRTERPDQREEKAKNILKKFFSRACGGGKIYPCRNNTPKQFALSLELSNNSLVCFDCLFLIRCRFINRGLFYNTLLLS